MMQGINLEALGVVLYLPVWAVAILTLAVGALVGLVNGVLIARCRVPAFVATLGSLYVARGIALLMTNGLTYNKLSGSDARAIPVLTGWASTAFSMSRSGC